MKTLSPRGKRIIAYSVVLLILVGLLALGWQWEVSGRMRRIYGDSPGFLTITIVQPDGEICERIDNVYPKAHYNWKGEVWQDEHLYWEDIRIESATAPHPPKEFQHNFTGPIEEGTLLCGFKRGLGYNWTYLPEQRVVYRVSPY